MCEPTTLAIATLAISAASSYMAYDDAKQQAKDHNEFAARNAELANRATVANYDTLTRRQIEEQDAAGQAKQEVQRERQSAVATARTSAGEAGVSGLSVDSLLRDYYFGAGESSRNIDTNLRNTVAQLDSEKSGARLRGEGQINSIPMARGPSPVAYAARTVGQGLTIADGAGWFGRGKTNEPIAPKRGR